LNRRTVLVAACTALLLACAGEERPDEVPDGPSGRPLKPSDVRDAVPRPEPRSRYGNNSPYVVMGNTYRVLDSAAGYHEKGIASWYGSKFQGRRTSSGEPYDMHKATAAHKSLPLPTYAEVTNLENGKKVIVKINDRGPFHDNRIIDLSYGAAVKIGMTGTGTARVEVRAITFDQTTAMQASVKAGDGAFLQAGAFHSRKSAEQLADALERDHLEPVSVHRVDGLYKVWMGPYRHDSELEAVTRRVVELGYERPHKVNH